MERDMSVSTDRLGPALATYSTGAPQTASVEVSIVMPCLNESETLHKCIEKAHRALRELDVIGEVVVADNGSTDGSQEIASSFGARLVQVSEKGYGNALRAGIRAARGKYIIMGDSDDSYDFSAIKPFVEKLREGYDLVMGNRFRGGIMPGAMPWKHQWIGNPVLTGIGRLFFGSPVADFHCGLRGFSKPAFESMDLRTTGMEFASEMVIKSTLMRMKITEVPIVLHKDGRSHPPHLRSWRDGWRHLRFMLLFSPRWLFLIPGFVLFVIGSIVSLWVWGGPRQLGPVVLDIHTLLVAAMMALVGHQLIVFATFTKRFAVSEGLHPPSRWLDRLDRVLNLEIGLLFGFLVCAAGAILLVAALWDWSSAGFGDLEPRAAMRRVIPAVVLMALGVQTVFASLFLSILRLRRE